MVAPRRLPSLQPVFRGVFESTSDRAYEIALHQHHDYELIRAARGVYRCELNGAAFALRPGQALLVKPGDLHLDRFDRAGIFYQAVSFYLEEADSGRPFPLFADGVRPEAQRLAGGRALLAALVGRLACERRTPDCFSPRLCRAVMEELFWTVVRALPPEARRPELVVEEAEGLRFRAALRQLFAQRLGRGTPGVDEMASALHVSRRTLARQCRRWLGASPAEAFLRYRIDRAADLLRQTSMSCQEIAAYLGFANPYHFSAVFKRLHGLSPVAYREGGDPHGPRFSLWPE